MCIYLDSLFNKEFIVYYITQVFDQGINIKTMCPNYIFEFRNTKPHLLQVYLGTWGRIEIVMESHVC